MNSLAEFNDLRERAFQKMDAARKSGQVDEIIRYARIVQDIDAAVHNGQATLARVSALLSSEDRSDEVPQEVQGANREGEGLSRKARGRLRREEYVHRLGSRGVHLRKLKNRGYHSSSGKVVGIGYASEVLPNKWWMGLPDEHYDILILLCETASTEILDFILPPEFVQKVWPRFTVSGKQREWHIERHGDVYELEPKKGFGSIGGYLSRLEALQ